MISLLFAHNFLEFFGITRGYGISMALLAGSLFYTIQALKKNEKKYYLYTLLFIIPACFANLTLINSYILLLFILGFNIFRNIKQGQYELLKRIFLVLAGVVPIALFMILLFRLQAEGELYYGKQSGFFEVSVKSLTSLLSGSDNLVFPIIGLSIGIFVFLLFIWKIYDEARHKKKFQIINSNQVFFFLLFGNVFAYILENRLFGTNYPEDRTGLFLYLFLAGSLFFALDQLKTKRKLIRFIPVIPFIFFQVHFFSNMNLSWSSLENQAIPERFYDYIAEKKEPGNFPPTLQGYQMRVMRWNYFNYRKGDELSGFHVSGYPRLDADFQIVEPGHLPEWYRFYNVIDSARHSGLYLLERKHKLGREAVFKKGNINSHETLMDEYFEFQRGTLDTLKGNTLYFGFELNLTSPDFPFHGWIVVSVSNQNKNMLRYEIIPLDWYRSDWGKENRPFIMGTLVHDIPQEATEYVAYIWNIRKAPFKVDDSSISIFRINMDYDPDNF
ncbi:MAG: hypothetical protein K8S16_03315 [Bacteroidales bacterium]|nr:hypothetical protein [Bacteroidales bacterium]